MSVTFIYHYQRFGDVQCSVVPSFELYECRRCWSTGSMNGAVTSNNLQPANITKHIRLCISCSLAYSVITFIIKLLVQSSYLYLCWLLVIVVIIYVSYT